LNNVVIIGAGYVGLTLGLVSAKVGHDVYFIDINDSIVSSLNKREPTFYEKGLQDGLVNYFKNKNDIAFKSLSDLYKQYELNKNTIFVISLGTPLNIEKKALLLPIKKAAIEVRKWMKKNDILILRSTVAVGTSRYLVNTIKGLDLCFCPERTIEGKAIEELQTIPQVISGSSTNSINKASAYFKTITKDIVYAKTLETAELIKLASNTFRDLNFAYSNLLALIAHQHGINVNELINLSNFRYERNAISFPGLVGGPCLEKDAYILAESYPFSETDFIVKARKLNEKLALKAIDFIKNEMNNINNTVLICGAAFKGRPETSDIRGSFIFKIIEGLNSINISKKNIHILDPIVKTINKDFTVINEIGSLNNYYDFMIQLTNHDLFNTVEFNLFVDKSISHIISFWPRKLSLKNKNNSLYMGGTF
jgi:UDP-N-acetyl-D-mannosaminuronic acid dehydrogenase